MKLFSKQLTLKYYTPLWIVVAGIGLLSLSGCASKGDDFYKHQPILQPLDIPPDLTRPDAHSGFEIPEIGSVETKKVQLEGGASVILRKDGRLRWLEIDAMPEEVWNSVKDFWVTKKVPVEWQNLKLGILETQQVDNYESDFARDRFRVRIEPGKQPNTSELYLSHRGIQDAFVDGEVISGWAKTLSDPELEIEVLGEMLSYFGLAADRKAALLDEHKTKADSATLALKADVPSIVMNESSVRSWRFVMQAVDRMGYIVIDRDKKAGWLDVRVEGKITSDFIPGFSLSNKDRDIYRVQLLTNADVTTMTILNDQGQPDHSEQAKQFLKELHKHL